jgi:hypothetical protein
MIDPNGQTTNGSLDNGLLGTIFKLARISEFGNNEQNLLQVYTTDTSTHSLCNFNNAQNKHQNDVILFP